jgi:putative phage-type endonuclease
MLDLKLRQTYLGGTDLVAISGFSKWKKPGDVWLEKVKGNTTEDNPAMEMGRDLEPVVAMRHARRFSAQLVEHPDPVFDPEFDFIAANPDRLYANQKRVLECKTAGEEQLYRHDTEWGEDCEPNSVPIYYLGQVNHYIGTLGFDDGVLSCLFLGKNRIQRDYPITFDPELFGMMRQNGINFWQNFIEPKLQPPIEFFSPEMVMKAVADQAMAHGGKKGIAVEADPMLERWAEEYKELSDKINGMDALKRQLAGKIASWIAGNQATKVVHAKGSFTYQKPEEKPEHDEFAAEPAWFDLLTKVPNLRLPDGVMSDFIRLAQEIKAKYTTTVKPEPATPRLHPYWR